MSLNVLPDLFYIVEWETPTGVRSQCVKGSLAAVMIKELDRKAYKHSIRRDIR